MTTATEARITETVMPKAYRGRHVRIAVDYNPRVYKNGLGRQKATVILEPDGGAKPGQAFLVCEFEPMPEDRTSELQMSAEYNLPESPDSMWWDEDERRWLPIYPEWKNGDAFAAAEFADGSIARDLARRAGLNELLDEARSITAVMRVSTSETRQLWRARTDAEWERDGDDPSTAVTLEAAGV